MNEVWVYLSGGSLSVALLELVLKSLLLAALAVFLGRFLRRLSAAVLTSVWTLALLLLLLLPLFSLSLPSWTLPGNWTRGFFSLNQSEARTFLQESGLKRPASIQAALAEKPALPATGSLEGSVSVDGPAESGNRSTFQILFDLLPVLWLLGFVTVVLKLLLGHLFVRRCITGAQVATDPGIRALSGPIQRRLGIEQRVTVYLSDSVEIPATGGIVRPFILLPAGSAAWDEERLVMTLLHELAHVSRRDVLVQHLSLLSCALYWFNPLAWKLASSLKRERERACDDLVLGQGVQPSRYASHLLDVVRRGSSCQMAGSAIATMAQPGDLERRVRFILDPRQSRRQLSPRILIFLTLTSTLCWFPLATLSFAGTEEKVAGPAAAASQTPARPPKPPAPPRDPEHPKPPAPEPPPAPAPPKAPEAPPAPPSPAANSQATPPATVSPVPEERNGEFNWNESGSEYLVRFKGVAISPDYTAIQRIGRDGFFDVRSTGPGLHLRLTAGAAGRFHREFIVRGQVRPWGPESDKLLQRALKHLEKVDKALDSVSRATGEKLTQLQNNLRELQHQLQHSQLNLSRVRDDSLDQARQALEETRRHLTQIRRQVLESTRQAMLQVERQQRQVARQMDRLRQNLESTRDRLRALKETTARVRRQAHAQLVRQLESTISGIRLPAEFQARLRARIDSLATELLERVELNIDEQSWHISIAPSRSRKILTAAINKALQESGVKLDKQIRSRLDQAVEELVSKWSHLQGSRSQDSTSSFL